MTVLFQNQFHEKRFLRLWWAQDGTLCHGLLAVRGRQNQLFGKRVLSLYNNTEWPPRYPDLTSCDFFLWGYLKDKVFRTPLESLNVLRQIMITECYLLREHLIRRSVQHMMSRADACVQRSGLYVEGNL